ncbi:hypothetical protein [Vibrio sp.]|uniref:hypothetical protein n=1 Tax=Vibrio sp. TaxID=678 RepID=UPI003F6BF621
MRDTHMVNVPCLLVLAERLPWAISYPYFGDSAALARAIRLHNPLFTALFYALGARMRRDKP